MFGYVRIDKPELLVKEYEAYRGVYCGLCRSMGKCTGCLSRMTLSYDFTFLLMFRAAVTGTRPEFELRRCAAHPTKKRPMLKHTEESAYVSCAAALLTYYKCLDDLRDETGKKRLRARSLFPTAKRIRKKALKMRPDLAALDGSIARLMGEITEREAERVPSVDLYAGLSGELLGEIFSFGLDETDARIARTVGRHIGKWIYLVDAYDDLAEDRRAGRFNPYLIISSTESGAGEEDRCRETVRVALLNELSEVEKAMDLLDFYQYPDLAGIMRNILYRGMPKTAEAILCGKAKDKREKA